MSILILTGPPASGKNTIATHVADRLTRCAVIDVVNIRDMIVQPKSQPWEGSEGEAQLLLSVLNASALVQNFHSEGYHAVVLDMLTDETAALYRSKLEGVALYIVQLLPSEDEVASRLLSRPDYLSRGSTDELYEQQSEFALYDERLDNTLMSPEEAADWLLEHWEPGRK